MIKKFDCDKLRVEIYNSRSELGAKAVKDIEATILQLFEKQEFVRIVFAAAPSQTEVLKGLRESSVIDWRRIIALHMDEYIGLAKGTPQLFSEYLNRNLFKHCPFHKVYLFDPTTSDCLTECQRYSAIIRGNIPDIIILGIGENGHLAFNDPYIADFHDPQLVKVVRLERVSREQQVNDGCFSDINDVPTHAFTLTIPALLLSSHFFCVVPHARKCEAVTRMLNDAIDEACPATVLRQVDNITLYLDKDSGANVLK